MKPNRTALARLDRVVHMLTPHSVAFQLSRQDVIRMTEDGLAEVAVVQALPISEFDQKRRTVLEDNLCISGKIYPIPLAARWRPPYAYLSWVSKPNRNSGKIGSARLVTYRGDPFDETGCSKEVDVGLCVYNHELAVKRIGTNGDAVEGKQNRYQSNKRFRDDGSRVFSDNAMFTIETSFASLRHYLGLRPRAGLVITQRNDKLDDISLALEGLYLKLVTIMKVGAVTESVDKKVDAAAPNPELKIGDSAYLMNHIDERTLELIGIYECKGCPNMTLVLDDDGNIVLPDRIVEDIVKSLQWVEQVSVTHFGVDVSDDVDDVTIHTYTEVLDFTDGGRMRIHQGAFLDDRDIPFTSGMRMLADKASLPIDVEDYLSQYGAMLDHIWAQDHLLEHPDYLANVMSYSSDDPLKVRAAEIYVEARNAFAGFELFVRGRLGFELSQTRPGSMRLSYPLSQAFGEGTTAIAQEYLAKPWSIPHATVRASVIAMIREGHIDRAVLGELLLLASTEINPVEHGARVENGQLPEAVPEDTPQDSHLTMP